MADVLSLSDECKRQILEHWQYKCYICLGDIIDPKDIRFGRISPGTEDDGGGPENIVPLHGFCAGRYGDIDPAEAREIAKVDRGYSPVFGEIYRGQKEKPRVIVNRERMLVSFEGGVLRLYRCPNTGVYYFYHQIPIRFIEAAGTDVSPEINRERVVRLAAHLKRQVQLSPAVCFWTDGRLCLVDGKHRAAAQYLGNENAVLDCKVFIDLPAAAAAAAVTAGRSERFGPRRDKVSPLAVYLRRRYQEPIRQWKVRNPDDDVSEYGLLCEQLGLSKARAGGFIVRAAAELASEAADVAMHIGPEKTKLMTETMFRFLVRCLIRREPLSVPLTAGENMRAEEHDNLIDVLRCIIGTGLISPGGSGSNRSETMFRGKVMLIWARLLAEALQTGLGRGPAGAVCYGERFSETEKSTVQAAVRRLFSHPAWSDPRQAGMLHRRKKADVFDYLAAAGLTARCLLD